MKKRIIAVSSAIALLASTLVFTSGAVKSKEKNSNMVTQPTTAITTVMEKPTDLSKTRQTTTTATKVQTTKTTKATKAKTTTANKVEKVKVPSNATASKIIKGAKCVQSWKVKSAQSSAYIEKVVLTLPIHKNGKVTSQTTQRYGYFAIVDTVPGNVKMIDSEQVTNEKVNAAKTIASSANALVAVNNEMCAHDKNTFVGYLNAANDLPNATVIKNGMVAQKGIATPSLACNKDGTWSYPVYVDSSNTAELIKSGVNNTVGYTYPMIWNGEKYNLPDTNSLSTLWGDYGLRMPGDKRIYANDHTVIGQINKNKYVLAVSDGFGQAYLWDYLLELGVQNGYWCNGGHCSVMYVKGYGCINRPTDSKPCQTVDTFCVF